MHFLVTSDRPETLSRAVRYASFLGDHPELEITLLGVYVGRDQAEAHASALDQAANDLQDSLSGHVRVDRQIGKVPEVLLQEIRGHDYDLVLLGVHRRRRLDLLRPKLVAKFIARRTRVPLLVVSPEWYRLEKILICTGAEPEDEQVVRYGGDFAQICGASVTLLHVMSQMQMVESANRQDLESGHERHIEQETHEGEHLERAMEILEQAGIGSDRYEVKLSHGLVVDKIMEEGQEGEYDLIILGAVGLSTDEGEALEVEHFMHENVPVRVLSRARRPVLIVLGEAESGLIPGGGA